MISNIHICSFSGKVADLTARETKDTQKVLAALKVDPMVSCFDMGEKGLWKTIKALEDAGKIKSIPCNYPWTKYEVLKDGEA
ncbi:MAG: hypothetical protein WC341_00525 [Bacteroidales bacterium]|jgi:hypothetical protein